MKQDVDWAGNRVAQLQSHVQEVEDSENENQDEHDDTNDDDDERRGWDCLSQVQSHTLRMGDRVGLFCKVISINDVLLMCVKNIVQNFSAIF